MKEVWDGDIVYRYGDERVEIWMLENDGIQRMQLSIGFDIEGDSPEYAFGADYYRKGVWKSYRCAFDLKYAETEVIGKETKSPLPVEVREYLAGLEMLWRMGVRT